MKEDKGSSSTTQIEVNAMGSNSKVRVATAAEVRAYAAEHGIEVGKRGRFKPSLVEAFNTANKGTAKYTEGTEAPTVPLKVKVVSAKTGKSRSETRNFTKGEVRTLAG